MSKLTSRIQLLAHNRRLKYEKQIVIKQYKTKTQEFLWEYNAMKSIQNTWMWKLYCMFKKPKVIA